MLGFDRDSLVPWVVSACLAMWALPWTSVPLVSQALQVLGLVLVGLVATGRCALPRVPRVSWETPGPTPTPTPTPTPA